MCKAVLIIMCCAVFSACATVEIKKITETTYTDGLRFYRPDLYLFVTKDKDGNLQTSVIPLPNKNEEYVLRTTAGIGAVEMSAKLEGGWNLTDVGSKIDSKVPETITALTGVVQAAGGLAALRTSLPLEPGLYRIDFAGGKVDSLKKINLVPN